MDQPTTIQIFLPTGDPSGIRIAEITTSILRGIEIPRSLLGEFYKLPESGQVGIYYLFGEDENETKRVYIGQTSHLKNRLTQHNNDKDFWKKAVVFVSQTNNLTQTHVSYLESLAIEKAKAADRYVIENNTQGNKTHVPLPLKADCKTLHQLSDTLLGTLGYPIFKPLVTHQQAKEEEFFCKRNGANGRGLLTDEGFVVFKDSITSENTTDKDDRYLQRRNELIRDGVLQKQSQGCRFTKDYLFNSPSAASAVLIGNSSNGWQDWKDRNGKTLHEIKRQDIAI